MLMVHKLYDGFDYLQEMALPAQVLGVQFQSGNWLNESQHFDMGEISMLEKFVPFADVLRKMPYPKCWFECYESDQRFGVHAVSNPAGEEVAFSIFLYNQKTGWSLVAGSCTQPAVDHVSFTPKTYSAGAFVQDITPVSMVVNVLGFVARFLSALRCNNVQAIKIEPDAKLQKARAKRGKKPFFSHWVLVLKGKGQNGEWLGGTHSSPRVHLRRSHFREYAPGKFTCVTECVVGNKKLGAVSKTYAFEPAMA